MSSFNLYSFGGKYGKIALVIIYLVRHGQTTGDVENRYGGDYDDRLTGFGQRQAKALAPELLDKGIEVIYTSPRIRARETSRILQNDLKVGVALMEDFRERNHYGILSGLTKAEAKKKYPKEVEKVKDYKTCATDGEEYADFEKRVRRAFKDLLKTKKKTVMVVTHGGVCRFVYREMLKKGEIELEDCSYSVLELTARGIKLISNKGVLGL